MIEDVLRFVTDAAGGVSLPRVRARFPTVGQVLKSCLDRGLLELRGQCYFATAAGRALLAAPQATLRVKRCPGCGEVKAETEFWKDASHSHGPHGLYAYCKDCCKRRKERLMELKQLEARVQIKNAGRLLVDAASRWDEAVFELTRAWSDIMAADDVLRLNRKTAGIDFDSGRMEARLVYPHAMFALLVNLADVRFRIDVPFFRDCGMPLKLAAYVGETPHSDYFDADPAPDSSPPPGEEGGAGAPSTSDAPAPMPEPPVRRARRKRKSRRRARSVVAKSAPDLPAEQDAAG